MSILSVDNISPIGSGTSVTVNNAATLVVNNVSISGVTTITGHTGNVRLDLHATASGTGSQIKLHNDHGTAYFGQAGDTSGDLLVYNESSTDIKFFTNGNNERLSIDSSGRVLIGQTSIISGIFGSLPPRFSVSTPTASPAIFATFSNDTYASRVDLLKSRNATVGSHTVVQAGDALGEIYFGGSDGDQFHGGALIQAVVDSGVGNDDMPAHLRFYTNGGYSTATERLRLTSTGQLYINTSGTDTMLGIKHSGNNSVEFFTCRNTSDTLKFYIHHSGNTYNTNGNYSQISDQSLKENIVDAKSQWNDIKNIKIRNFNFTEASGYDTHTQIGCVAQEVETVSPKLVSTPRADGIKTVSTSVLYMKGMKALQEAMTRIETLEAEVAALKSN